MAHFSVWQRSPFRNNFMPSRRHCRQTGPIYRAKSNLPKLQSGAVYNPWVFFLLYFLSPFPGLHQTLRFFGGRQPLCGMGVRSLMILTSSPAVDSARTADSRPAPRPLTSTFTVRKPDSLALLSAVSPPFSASHCLPL